MTTWNSFEANASERSLREIEARRKADDERHRLQREAYEEETKESEAVHTGPRFRRDSPGDVKKIGRSGPARIDSEGSIAPVHYGYRHPDEMDDEEREEYWARVNAIADEVDATSSGTGYAALPD